MRLPPPHQREMLAMKLAEFKKAGHWPTLLAAFLYFDISFMAWVALGPLIVYIAHDMNLAVNEKFTLVAIPVLAGALLRVPMGLLADIIGAKRTGIIAQLVVIAATAAVWQFGLTSKLAIELFGLALGVGGASFAVALPQASRWYPPQYQGLVMGIAGAGNMGVVLDTLLAPSIAENWGWQSVFGCLLIPMLMVLAYYIVAAKDAPGERKPVSLKAYGTLLKDSDSRWFMFFYFITFGGFVGLANALPLYFTVQYQVSGVAAGLLVALIVAFGSGFRPVGGLIADRIGGIRSLSILFGIVVAAYFIIAFMPEGPTAPTQGGWSLTEMPRIAWFSVLLFSIGVLALGMGNGAVFQLIPLRFRHEIGLMTGLVGCAGGIGGFFLAQTLGFAKGTTGGFGAGFLFFGVLALLGFIGLAMVKVRWRTTWGAVSGARV
ncbi:nitrate/nitrite transporter [Bradyrhizobium tropiciagri]|uniref:nitrate/nitrite transporter n=1 Tax=Bradyrhizobium tropiciagri TaxID=312253 RepID=UPI002012FFC0|nr:nitrate/nitrite transporter [Bradyrhizobium tropiciagri]